MLIGFVFLPLFFLISILNPVEKKSSGRKNVFSPGGKGKKLRLVK